MRNRIRVHKTGRIGDVLTTVELVIRLCCRTVVASGLLEARKSGRLGELAIKLGSSSTAPCARSTRRPG